MPPHGTNNPFDRYTLSKGANETGMEHPLADVRLNGHKQRPVREPPQESCNEYAVVGESKPEPMEEHNWPCLGVFGIPVRWDADHVLDVPMYIKFDAPLVFQELVSENVTNSDEYVPEEGTKQDMDVVEGEPDRSNGWVGSLRYLGSGSPLDQLHCFLDGILVRSWHRILGGHACVEYRPVYPLS